MLLLRVLSLHVVVLYTTGTVHDIILLQVYIYLYKPYIHTSFSTFYPGTIDSTYIYSVFVSDRNIFFYFLFFSIFFVSCCFVWACATQFRRPTKTHDSMYGLNQRPFDSIRNRPTLPEPKPTRGRILLEAIYLATSIWSNQIPMIPIRHCLGNKYQGVQWFPINLKAYCTKKYFAPPVAMVSRDVCGCCF